MIVALWRQALLVLDDCRYAAQSTIPYPLAGR
jgi:hypothetical protein